MLGWAAAFAFAMAIGAAPETDLTAATEAYRLYDYTGAAALLKNVRERIDELAEDRANEALRLSAVTAMSLGDNASAEDHLLALLLRWPEFEPPKGAWPPVWLRVLESARARIPDRDAPTVNVDAPKRAPPGQPIVIRAQITDPSGVRSAEIFLQNRSSAWTMTSSDGTTFAATIPANAANPPGVDFWIEVYDRYGNGPGYLDRSRRPLTIHIDSPFVVQPVEPESSSVLGAWWFWAIAGAVVVGATATALVLRPDDSGRVVGNVEFP